MSEMYVDNTLNLGWRSCLVQQLVDDEFDSKVPGRILGQQRSEYLVAIEKGEITLTAAHNWPAMVVGDWLLLNQDHSFHRLLDRYSVLSRKAAGHKVEEQLIAANLDTLFIVCALNANFNLNRIERYLALAFEAGIEPVVVLTRADQCEEPEQFVRQVSALSIGLAVECVNALDVTQVAGLAVWCGKGRTVGLVGSSGVGKSTLVNSLTTQEVAQTGGIRESDSHGKHTTTSRFLHRLPQGGLIMDTPGMREIQLADCEAGVSEVFSEIDDLASRCRFSDCTHTGEPGCKVLSAIEKGDLDERRLTNYQKLIREQAINGASIAERRAGDRKLGKMYRSVQSIKRQNKQGLAD